MTDDNRQDGEDLGKPDDGGVRRPAADAGANASGDGGTGPEPGQPAPKKGRIRYQEAGTTKPREPTLAEQRARRRAMAKESAEHSAEVAEAERKAKVRRRVLIGGGVTVGVVATVALWYAAGRPDETTAVCTDRNGVVVDDDYCDTAYASSHGGYSSGGFIYIGGNSYRYNYGGTGALGQRVSGGSYDPPSTRTTVKTRSGSTIQRGGFGISGGGKSGGS